MWRIQKRPKVNRISIDKTNLKAGETATVTIEASDDVSQLMTFSASFRREGNEDDYIMTDFSDRDTPSVAELEISPYLPSGTYVLDSIQIIDNAGNHRYYDAEPTEGYSEKLPNSLKITVINDDLVTPPTQPEGNKPSRPGSSANSSANSSNGFGVVNYESEKPDPADKQAVKAYNFWQDAKSKIRKTAEGKTLRLNVPKEITNLPAQRDGNAAKGKCQLALKLERQDHHHPGRQSPAKAKTAHLLDDADPGKTVQRIKPNKKGAFLRRLLLLSIFKSAR